MSSDEESSQDWTDVLGYLLKHANLNLTMLTTSALAPFDIDGRELGVLRVLAGREPASQQEVSQLMGVDRTTMVALLDTLERKGIVTRHPHADDRRRNVVELTEAGQDVFRQAAAVYTEAERSFLAPLTPQAAQQLRQSLQTLLKPR